jgi:hypothetical protein
MELNIYFISLRAGDTDYAGEGIYHLIGTNTPTVTTINNFICQIPIPDEDMEYRKNYPINLFQFESEGEPFNSYWSNEEIEKILADFDFDQLNSSYLVYKSFPDMLKFYNEEDDNGSGILKNKFGSPLLIK